MLSTMRYGAAALAAWGALFGAGELRAEGAADSPVRAKFISEIAEIVPGNKFRTGVTFTIAEGWYLYWNGRNDAGSPVKISTEVPEGFLTKSQRWPAPRRLVTEEGKLLHVYRDEVTMILVVTAPTTLVPGDSVTFRANVEWTAGGAQTRTGKETLSFTLPVIAGLPRPGAPELHGVLNRADARVPRPLSPVDPKVKMAWAGDTFQVAAAGAREILFYPGPDCGELAHPAEDTRAEGGALQVRFLPDGEETGPAQGVLEVLYPEARHDRILRFNLEHPGAR